MHNIVHVHAYIKMVLIVKQFYMCQSKVKTFVLGALIIANTMQPHTKSWIDPNVNLVTFIQVAVDEGIAIPPHCPSGGSGPAA